MEVEPLVKAALDGYNCCIFAYGQTGAGKTHTMEGTEADRGIMYRALHTLFNCAASGHFGGGSSTSFKFTVTLLEVRPPRRRATGSTKSIEFAATTTFPGAR